MEGTKTKTKLWFLAKKIETNVILPKSLFKIREVRFFII